jgi:hypothetical protein
VVVSGDTSYFETTTMASEQEEEEEARYRAMVEFIGSFPTVSSPPVDISEMADGVAIFEALSEM